MTGLGNAALVSPAATTLPSLRSRAFAFQLLLVAAAVALPTLAHWLDLPVRWLLPIHWPVLVAGLVYGPLGGGAVGLLAPLASFGLSGMPTAGSVPVMVVELCTYGVLAGFLRGQWRWNAYAALAVALLAGRLVAVVIKLLAGAPVGFVAVAYGQGILAGLAQVALLPTLARWWIERERDCGASRLATGRSAR